MEQWSTDQMIEEIENRAVWKFLQITQDCEPLWALGVTEKDKETFHKVRALMDKYNKDVARERAAEYFAQSLNMTDEQYEAYCKGDPFP